MRIVIYGVGAIGGTLAVKLALAGTEVIGIARGAQLDAIARDGLLLRTPQGDLHARFPIVGNPDEIAFAEDDLIFLTMKTQDTLPALERLRRAGVRDQAIFCLQNGMANEDFALRLFAHVYGAVVAMPATFIRPGEVADFFAPKSGIFDVGRHGSGEAPALVPFTQALEAADFAVFVHDDIVPFKYAKLLMNLNNALDATLGAGEATKPYRRALRAEADAVLAKAGIVPASFERAAREKLAQMHDIAGAERVGSSSAQSLARGAGSIETDYLNGEIVLLGRKLGVPTPANAYFAELAQRLLHEKRPAGSVDIALVRRALPLDTL